MNRLLGGVPFLAGAAVVAAASLAAGCAEAPVTHFHTLLPAVSGVAVGGAAPNGVAWTLAPVLVPAQVDRPQWVVRGAGETIAVLESERWVAPLADELRAAVAERLTARLGSPGSVSPSTSPGGVARQVRIAVQRLDGAPGRYARLDAAWTIGAAGTAAPTLACRSVLEQAVPGGFAALADGHRGNVARLADAIAVALLATGSGAAAACPV